MLAWATRSWMLLNLSLAAIPVALAIALFRDPNRRRSAWWWAGVAVFVAFLPNAPYVATDLIHLRASLGSTSGARGTVVVLAAYGMLIGGGLVAYLVSLWAVRRWLVAQGRGRWSPLVELVLHALCAIGIALGRMFRLNSWELVTRPHAVIEPLGVPSATAVVVVATLFALLCSASVVLRVPEAIRQRAH